MTHYELLVIFPGRLSETELPKSEQIVRELCRAAAFTIASEEPLGKKKLAFPIKSEQYGYFHLISGEAEPSGIKEFENRLRLSSEIIRCALNEKPLQSAETRDREIKLRERVAHARAVKAASVAAPLAQPTVGPSIDAATLDKKLEEIFQAPETV